MRSDGQPHQRSFFIGAKTIATKSTSSSNAATDRSLQPRSRQPGQRREHIHLTLAEVASSPYTSAMSDPQATLRSYAVATNAHDLPAIIDLVRDDAVYWFSDASSHVGISAIRAVLESNFSAISNETYEISSHKWIVETDSVAVCLYRFNWSGTIDDKIADGSGRGTSVLVMTTDGWRIAHEHLSSGNTGFDPAP